jgi:NADP-dependent 3-hydroxy acid dehydrogenase YdfG
VVRNSSHQRLARPSGRRRVGNERGVVAITGAARGIGKATAAAFAQAGARVAIGDLDFDRAEQTAAEIGVIALALDVTEPTSLDAFVAGTEERLGPIDVLVNNAGIMAITPFLGESHELAQRQFDVNVAGVLFGMKAVLPRMLERGRGHIVNVASGAGKVGYPGVATYCGTKHAVVGITEGVRLELRNTPIGFSLVMPMVVDTELTSGMSPARGLRTIEPETVGTAIVDAVSRRRFEVYVPRQAGPLNRMMAMLPRRLRDATVHALRADRVLADLDPAERLAYRKRTEHQSESPKVGG